MLRHLDSTFDLRTVRRSATALLTLAILLVSPAVIAGSQDDKKKPAQTTEIKKDTGTVPTPKEIEKSKKQQGQAKPGQSDQPALTPAEAIVEFTILAYGGRKQIETARASINEQGTIRLATDQGDLNGSYTLRSIRKDKSWLDLIRTDLELTTPEAAQRTGAPATVKYVIAFNGATVWSAQNDQYTNPKPESEAAFRALLSHDYTTLLRYKEDGSKVELKESETVTGIVANVVEMTTPRGEKTKYWISSRTFRILHAEYELKLGASAPAIKYRVSYFYTPMRVVQNTLVPVRKVMTQDGNFVQEINLTTIQYTAKLEPEIFQHLQS